MSPSAKDGVDPGRCPLCGGDNGCAVVAGRPPEQCWCVDATFPPAIFAAIPERLRRRACVCRNCADRFAEKARERPEPGT